MFHVKHTSPVLNLELEKLLRFIGKNRGSGILIKDMHPAAFALILSNLDSPLIIISPDDKINMLYEYFRPNWENNNGLYFPHKEILADTPGGFISRAARDREICKSVIESFRSHISFVLTTERGASERHFSAQKRQLFQINRGSDFDLLIEWLIDTNYENTDMVLAPGSYSIRGGIVDVFPVTKNAPIRINFLAEEVEIFNFNIDTQLTEKTLETFELSPIDTSIGNLDLYEILLNSYTRVEIIASGDVFIGESTSSAQPYVFPLKPLSMKTFFRQYKENPQLELQMDSRLLQAGFSSINHNGEVFIIPDWLDKKVQQSSPENVEIKVPVIDFGSIEAGDYLIHQDYGVCRYIGLKSSEDGKAEYILLEFDDNSLISLSTHKIRKLSFYASGNQVAIIPDSLTKTSKWKRKKDSAKKQADEIVEELLLSYAERSSVTRHGLSFDNEIENIFLSRFPFMDTPDQTKAWCEIREDLSDKNKPMNRLLCGDVGFGKTEIAIRTSFRVVFNGKQVAILAPTTILVNQLYLSFKERLVEFGVSVDVVSRFRTKGEITKIFENIKQGKLDVVVGTHSLLSDKLEFSNLGLLIIDEEQRFGVNQKEKIQNIQKNIDVLSMSATPIPRTLHIAISGIRDISTLLSPPKSRYPINTQISYYDLKTIKDTILFEISRDGQVLFIHNEVKTIHDVVVTLTEMFPYLSVSYAHGQEPSKSLEKTISLFLQKKIDILVCTTIIETGIDIPNANTIIINKAHRFGLSQLHQIRGRVGRSTRQAYALLLIPKGFTLKRDAHRRLKTIEKHTRLGEGYNISVMDLEIRGAGSMFGYKQSGGAARIGAELYTQFINDAINRKLNKKQNNQSIDISSIGIAIFADGSIPISYINPTNIRLDFYRKLSQANTVSEVLRLEYEIKNRFGNIPIELSHLISETKLRIRCSFIGITNISYVNKKVNLEFDGNFIVQKIHKLLEAVFDYFDSKRIPFWHKENKKSKLKLTITPLSDEDIPTLLMDFFDKLDDVFFK